MIKNAVIVALLIVLVLCAVKARNLQTEIDGWRALADRYERLIKETGDDIDKMTMRLQGNRP